MTIRMAILAIGCLALMFLCVFFLKVIESSSSNVKSISLTLDDVYSKLDTSQLDQKLNSSELNDIVQMGGFIAIKNHEVALGGICQLQMKEVSIFSDVFLEVSKINLTQDQNDEGETLQGDLYQTDLTIKGDKHSINSKALYFSEQATKSIRSSFELIKDCHIKKANEGGISDLLAEQITSPIVK